MMVRISARQEPQLVPALTQAPTASTVWQPSRIALVIWLMPTLKQEADGGTRIGSAATRPTSDEREAVA